jgi:iron(III) transport system ATP-binding protein
MTDPLLSLSDIGLTYGSTQVLDNLNLSVNAGEIVAILGPSGCGKSSLLRLVAGLVYPNEGEISLRQVSMGEDHPPERRAVGMVFQDFALFNHQTVAQNIGFGLHGHEDAAPRTASLMKRLGLQGLGDRLPAQLSGGQQQRVGLARALAPEPDLLLLDEPFANLDAQLRGELGTWCRAMIKAEGAAALLVTHDRSEAMALADRIVVLSGQPGQVRQSGSAQELYEEPSHADVARLMGSCLLLPARASGTTAKSALGDHTLKREAQGSVLLLVHSEDLRLIPDQNGPLKIEHSHFEQGAWLHRVRYNKEVLLHTSPSAIVASHARAETLGPLWPLVSD